MSTPATRIVVPAPTWIVTVVPSRRLSVIVSRSWPVTVPPTCGRRTETELAVRVPSAAFSPVATIAAPTVTSDRFPSARSRRYVVDPVVLIVCDVPSRSVIVIVSAPTAVTVPRPGAGRSRPP